ncbi:ser thr protein phosphatase family protein [Moniliophthora roreri]|nr:ser thr protein phosphatase family protein [Moniliophthora roreri]
MGGLKRSEAVHHCCARMSFFQSMKFVTVMKGTLRSQSHCKSHQSSANNSLVPRSQHG